MSLAVGTMPVGAGPVGGVTGTDYVGPQVVNIAPPPGSTYQSPLPHIEFDVLDFEGHLVTASVKASVNGRVVYDESQAGRFFWGWTGTVTTIDYGIRVSMKAPTYFPPGSAVVMRVEARDSGDHRTVKTWSFTVAPGVAVTRAQVLTDRCVELEFAPSVRVNGELFRPSNYSFSVRLGPAEEVYARTVTASSAVEGVLVNKVTVCMRDYFSRNGRYTVRVQGIVDEYGRVVDTDSTVTG